MSPNKVNEAVTASHIRMASVGLRHSAAQTSEKYFTQPHARSLFLSIGVDCCHWTAPHQRSSDHGLSGGRQPRDNIYVNVVHAVDGAWNFDGKALTNAELGAAISKGEG
jgi:hypothetical protein